MASHSRSAYRESSAVLDFVFEQLSARVDRVRETALAARVSPSAEAIHQLRVSIRRLTESMRSLEEWVKSKRAGKLRDRLRPLMKAAGETRNFDVAVELCLKSPVISAAGVAAAIPPARTEAWHQLIGQLLGLRLDKLRPPCDPNPEVPPARVLAAGLLAGLVPAYWKAGDVAARSEASWSDLHSFRLATKHLRYTMELFAATCGRGVAERLDVLKRVQTHLGEVNDCDTARGLDVIANDTALAGWLAARQKTEREKFIKTWAEERKRSRGGANWVRYFSRPQ